MTKSDDQKADKGDAAPENKEQSPEKEQGREHLSISSSLKTKSWFARNRVFVFISVFFLGGALIWWSLQPRKQAEVGVVRRGNATAAVYGTLMVEPEVETIVRAQTSGIIDSLLVKEGDLVKEGTVLAEITDDRAKERLNATRTALEAQVRHRQIGPGSLPELNTMREQIKRLKKLVDIGNISAAEYDRELNRLKTLEDKVKLEQLALDTAVKNAQADYDAALSMYEQRLITSPQEGVVLEKYIELGQVVTVREEMFKIGSTKYRIHAKVNEEDVGQVKVGMKALVRLYSHDGQSFTAEVLEILPGAENREYSVMLKMLERPDPFLPGMTGELNIIIGQRKNTLIMPARAIVGGVRPHVYIVKSGVVYTRTIKAGYQSIETAEALEGVEEGDMVILSDHDLFSPGDRVNTYQSKSNE